jgi:hypothetical protein
MKIILTNWITLFGVFTGVFVFSIGLNLTQANLSYNIFQAIAAALFLVIGYGMIFWAFLIVSLVVLDIILIVSHKKNLKVRLMIEWLIISSPFICGMIKYHQWIFAVGIVSFLIAQLLREKYILKKGLG